MKTIPPSETPAQWKVHLLGVTHVVLITLLMALVYELWPQYQTVTQEAVYEPTTRFFWSSVTLSLEQRVIILVFVTGAIGSFIHSATSFSNFVGERKIEKSWFWWYVLRPFVGMSVAFVFYMVFRGGLLTNTQAEHLNIYGVLTLSALAGLFSDRATLKLKEIFEALFQPKDERSGKLNDNGNNHQDNAPKNVTP